MALYLRQLADAGRRPVERLSPARRLGGLRETPHMLPLPHEPRAGLLQPALRVRRGDAQSKRHLLACLPPLVIAPAHHADDVPHDDAGRTAGRAEERGRITHVLLRRHRAGGEDRGADVHHHHAAQHRHPLPLQLLLVAAQPAQVAPHHPGAGGAAPPQTQPQARPPQAQAQQSAADRNGRVGRNAAPDEEAAPQAQAATGDGKGAEEDDVVQGVGRGVRHP